MDCWNILKIEIMSDVKLSPEHLRHRNNYRVVCIDDYKDPPEKEEWDSCPRCGLRPKIWEFNNGSSTACGCGESRYDHWAIYSESIGSRLERNAKRTDSKLEGSLRNNWNHYCRTGEVLFEKPRGGRKDGRW